MKPLGGVPEWMLKLPKASHHPKKVAQISEGDNKAKNDLKLKRKKKEQIGASRQRAKLQDNEKQQARGKTKTSKGLKSDENGSKR